MHHRIRRILASPWLRRLGIPTLILSVFALAAPTLLVLGDHDFTTVDHGAVMQRLIPGAHLAVLPNTTHMTVTRRAEFLLPMLAEFLD